MKVLQQYRPFIYRDREDIDSFLEEAPFWADLYELFLDIKDNAYFLKIPSVQMFNEVCYQCTRILLDKHPEERIWDNYLNPAKENLGWRYASDLCFALVYAVLSLKAERPNHVSYFLQVLKNRKLKTDTCYFPYVESFLSSRKGYTHNLDLSPRPEHPNRIREGVGWWRNVTNEFDQDRICEIVALWNKEREQLEVLDIIERNFDEDEKHQDLPF